MDNVELEPKPTRKPYEAPAIVYEAPLEVRAGSPLSIEAHPDPEDPEWIYTQK